MREPRGSPVAMIKVAALQLGCRMRHAKARRMRHAQARLASRLGDFMSRCRIGGLRAWRAAMPLAAPSICNKDLGAMIACSALLCSALLCLFALLLLACLLACVRSLFPSMETMLTQPLRPAVYS